MVGKREGEGEERAGGFDKGAQALAENIIDKREEKEAEVERKEIINICVCGLLLLLIIGLFDDIDYIYGYLFTSRTGDYVILVYGLIQTPGGALVAVFNGLIDGIIRYTFAPIINAYT